MVILLMIINNYSIGGLLMVILLMNINGYFISGY